MCPKMYLFINVSVCFYVHVMLGLEYTSIDARHALTYVIAAGLFGVSMHPGRLQSLSLFVKYCLTIFIYRYVHTVLRFFA